MVSNFTIVMIHCLRPSFIKEKEDYAEKRRNRSFEIVYIRHLLFASRQLAKANLIGKEKLSKLFEHNYEAKNKDNKELDFIKSLKKHIYDKFLVSEEVFMDI